MHSYPISIRFKVFAVSAQISVTDAEGREILFVKRKAFKLKEHIEVFRDSTMSELLYDIHADRVLDFNSEFNITEISTNRSLGVVGREGMRSIWRSRYYATTASGTEYSITEENPFTKLVDGLMELIPYVGGFLGGLVFHPKYLVRDEASMQYVFRVTKKLSITEGKFEITTYTDPATLHAYDAATLDRQSEEFLLAAILTMVLIERTRG